MNERGFDFRFKKQRQGATFFPETGIFRHTRRLARTLRRYTANAMFWNIGVGTASWTAANHPCSSVRPSSILSGSIAIRCQTRGQTNARLHQLRNCMHTCRRRSLFVDDNTQDPTAASSFEPQRLPAPWVNATWQEWEHVVELTNAHWWSDTSAMASDVA